MKTFKMIGATLMFLYMSYGCLFESLPGLYTEWGHKNEYVTAKHARITKAKCTNWNIFIFNTCVVEAVTSSGEAFSISDARFGRAPTEPIYLLERKTNPPIFSTSVSLATIRQRLYMLVCGVVLSVLFLFGLFVYVMQLMWNSNHGPPQNMNRRLTVPRYQLW